jgi:hypothetical protein
MSEALSLALPRIRQAPRHPVTARYSLRLLCILMLTAVADFLFFRQPSGWTLGAFAFLANAAILLTHPALLKRRAAQIVLAANIMVASALVYSPSTLAIVLAIIGALALASLVHMAAVPHALRWAGRLFFMSVNALAMPLVHLARHNRVTRRLAKSSSVGPVLQLAFVPLLFGTVFVLLFSVANPVIESWMAKLQWRNFFNLFEVTRWLFWFAVASAMFILVKPRLSRGQMSNTSALVRADDAAPSVSRLFTAQSIILSLLMFNLLFGLQNILDIKFLYADAGFVNAASEAAYVNRGAWALIATALMAALFVLIALRRGSPLANNRLIRLLLGLWIGQNVLLVGSSIVRTLNYIETYSLTYLRVSGLIWMGLVAVGLVLICWRVLAHRTNSWLVNANALAAIAVLVTCCWVNFAGIIANYNVRHAAEVDGNGATLDVYYLNSMGPNSLPALNLYLHQASQPETKIELPVIQGVLRIKRRLESQLFYQQQNWRAWTVEGDRLQKAQPDFILQMERLNAKLVKRGYAAIVPPLTDSKSGPLIHEDELPAGIAVE